MARDLIFEPIERQPQKEVYYHTITKEDTSHNLLWQARSPKGVPVGYAIRECLGRLVPNDIGRTLRITVTGQHAHCQLSKLV